MESGGRQTSKQAQHIHRGRPVMPDEQKTIYERKADPSSSKAERYPHPSNTQSFLKNKNKDATHK